MTTEICCSCGIEFGMPDYYAKKRREDRGYFYCPNGHSQHYMVSTADTLRREKEESERKLQAQLNEANHAKLVAEKERDKAIKDKRKVERRIAHGVCPCCNRTFADIANHMLTEHKDFRLPEGKRPKLIQGAA